MELVQLDPILVSSEMEADGDELDDDLLDEVEDETNEQRDENLVHSLFPAFSALITIDVMVRHRRQERHFDGQPPEKQGSWKFELLAHVSPFLAVVGEKTRDETDRPWKEFSKYLQWMSVLVNAKGERYSLVQPKA